MWVLLKQGHKGRHTSRAVMQNRVRGGEGGTCQQQEGCGFFREVYVSRWWIFRILLGVSAPHKPFRFPPSSKNID